MPTVIPLSQHIVVQLAARAEHPYGRMVDLVPDEFGFVELPDGDAELAAHPVVSRLLPRSDAEAKRFAAIRDAGRVRDETIAKARSDYAAAVTRAQSEASADLVERGTAWAERREAARARGEEFDEPHPDARIATDAARTSGPPSPTPTAAFRNEPTLDDAAATRVVAKPRIDRKEG